MKLVKIKPSYFNLCKEIDSEILDKTSRPYVLILKLKYNNKRQIFAIPLRSNISASEQKRMYFPLPPRPQTKPKNRHGLHFRKIIPVDNQRIEKYRIFEDNLFDKMIYEYIEKHLKTIIVQAQNYLDYYYENKPLHFSTNIESLIDLLNKTNF